MIDHDRYTDVVYLAERADEKLHRNTTVRMGIRVIQGKNPKHAVSTSNLYSISPKLQFDCKTQSARIMENDNEIVECDGEFLSTKYKIDLIYLINYLVS